jgi:hypothetical protein
VLANADRLEAASGGRRVEGVDLVTREADERIPVAQRMVEEGERVLACERGEPERHLREVDRDCIAIDAVQAALRDDPRS